MGKSMSRRDFLKTGTLTVAGMSLAPSMFASACSGSLSNLNEYMKYFGVNEDMLKKVIAAGLAKGGDYCDLFFEHSISSSIALQDKKVNRANSSVDFGVGIRVLKGDKTGFSFTEEISEKALMNAAKTAAGIANSGSKVKLPDFSKAKTANYYKAKTEWADVSIEKKIPFVEMANEAVFGLDEKVEKVNVYLNESSTRVMFVSSEGVVACDDRPLCSLGIVTVMKKGSRRESSYTSRSLRMGYEFLSEKMVKDLAKESVDNTKLLFDAVTPEGGEMPVVLGAGGSGILLHEAIGHTFEADFNRKEESIFCDKLGKKVAADFVSIVDDGTNPNNRGAINIDDEGNPTQMTYLVKDGILNSYIHDRLSAQHYGVKPTGGGRRESFRHVPLPRMRNTYMLNGPHQTKDIISSVKKGVFVNTFSNGEVQIGGGDFTFYVKSGYMIENGKLTQPIKDINLIGNGPKALADISMVSNDMAFDYSTWTCGKSGQSVPVGLGMPTVKVDNLTVGGK